MYSAGDVVFHKNALFVGNGQFEGAGFESVNFPGGALLNIGTMEASAFSFRMCSD